MKYTHLFISLISILIFACEENPSKSSLKQAKKEISIQKSVKKDTIPLDIVEKYAKSREVIFDIMQLKDSSILKNIIRDKYGYYTSFALDIHGKYIFLFDGIILHKIEIETKKIILSKRINTSIPIKKLSATILASKEGLGVLLFSSTNSIHQEKDSVKLLIFDSNLKENKKISVFYAGVRGGAKALDGILASHSLQMNKSREIAFVQKGINLGSIEIFEEGKQIYPYKTPKTSNSAYVDIFTSKIYHYNGKNKSIDYQGLSVYNEKKYHLIDRSGLLSVFNDKIFFKSKKTGNLCIFYIKAHKVVETPYEHTIDVRHFVDGSYSELIHRIRDKIFIRIFYYDDFSR